MKNLAYCERCMSNKEYKLQRNKKTSVLNNEEISFEAKEAICEACGNEIFVSDICDHNLNVLYEKYKIRHNIISIMEIKNILTKYSISNEELSLLLGWKSYTLKRYLNGDMPLKDHSNVLKKIYESIDYYSIVLQTNRDKLDVISYSKSRQTVRNLLNAEIIEVKMEAVIKYILIRGEDFTDLTLQKLLYFVQSFYYMFTNTFIFEEDCKAAIDGPVYASIRERYRIFGYKEVHRGILSNDKLTLDDFERNIVESVIKFYGCYSGKIIKQMTQNEAPWILSRTKNTCSTDLDEEDFGIIIDKSLISEYVISVKEKYNILNLLDIQKYSTDLFNKISM
ncbi:DUF4065 domain-containing protein [Clostridium chromiireducens]|uniref:DUF4065 domain-containing protein n=1 Tax=Clostridium chromiireducens TaxID=225345 RepID=A0A399ILV6_9CLOT|nr:type II toxin-antitoxin system antitoxin SocA domain-containing protein [Clostridium chromiireducens]RII33279.1 DUF4065 domain-containing protein [Clostridium chromiireducens]